MQYDLHLGATMNIDIPFLDADSWDAAMPERLRWLRENSPIHWSEPDGLWLLSRYDDVVYASKHNELFCSGEGVRPATPTKLSLIDEDEPRHGRVRRLINKGFTPRMVSKLEVAFLRLATESIDAIARDGECDFVDDLAVPMPLLLIAEMLGIRKEDREKFHQWSDAMIAGDGNLDKPEIAARAGKAFVEYATYVNEIIEDRRKNPRDDLLSILTGAKEAGVLSEFSQQPDEGVTDDEKQLELANDELTMITVLLLVAGNETTRNALSGGMQALIERPGERQKLIDDPSLIPSAVEEILRFVSPVHSFSRTTTCDTELAGQKIEKGQRVLMLYPSANRDAKEFDDPDSFRVERNPTHVAFGIGNHFCLGANLGRMELRVALEQLLQRLPDMEFSRGGPEIVPSSLVRCCRHMYVKFTPEA
jgi:cytochrome P450 family 142 subfamily A polypeptide 1